MRSREIQPDRCKIGIPAAIIGIVVMMVVPLPAIVLDLLIAVNITGAVLILLVACTVTRPLDFAVFPVAAADRHAVPAGAQRQRDPPGAAATASPAR